MALVTSKQSKPWSQDSIGSPEAYLIDSLNSIFLKRRPMIKVSWEFSNVTKSNMANETRKNEYGNLKAVFYK